MVTEHDIADGLRELGLDRSSSVVVHSSLRSFGRVEGGAETVCRALTSVCGTVVMPAFTFDACGLPFAPPGTERPHNAFPSAENWDAFDAAVRQAAPWCVNTPIDEDIGAIPEAFRRMPDVQRSPHPLVSWIATGDTAHEVLSAQTLASPLAPLDVLENRDGDVLLLGVGHWANTTIHLAEQRCGRSRFWRFGVIDDGVWVELPNIPGDSSAFARLDNALSPDAAVWIGGCEARRYTMRNLCAVVETLIASDPAALLDLVHPGDERTEAAYRQRLAWIASAS
jgi:aminoglycoside 3-N-acetyltransferase